MQFVNDEQWLSRFDLQVRPTKSSLDSEPLVDPEATLLHPESKYEDRRGLTALGQVVALEREAIGDHQNQPWSLANQVITWPNLLH